MDEPVRSPPCCDSELAAVPVFRGSHAASLEYGLVLDAKGIAYDRVESGEAWVLLVVPEEAAAAAEELSRYAAERLAPRESPTDFVPFSGSSMGAIVYAGILIIVAYCAGIELFGVDWFAVGALDSSTGSAGEWWRALTALTLHLDQEHLMGNLLFGVGIGVLTGRMFGPGIAWLATLLAGGTANHLDMLVSPSWHRAVGASTAVFAALGLLAGFGWADRRKLRERRLYRWAPLGAGICLLVLLGAGTEHVDVLGHLLGFVTGTGCGWLLAHSGRPGSRSAATQIAAGSAAILIVSVAWLMALYRA